MKKLFENWRDFGRGEGPVEPEPHLSAADNEHTEGEEFENQVAKLARDLGVEISIERDLDGVLHIKAYGHDGSHSPWNGPDDEMVDELDEKVDKDSMPCNKPRRTSSHKGKSHVVKACEDGKEKIIPFGEKGAKTAGKPKKGESEKMKKKRKSFKARHAKNIKKGKMSAAYWADKEKW